MGKSFAQEAIMQKPRNFQRKILIFKKCTDGKVSIFNLFWKVHLTVKSRYTVHKHHKYILT